MENATLLWVCCLLAQKQHRCVIRVSELINYFFWEVQPISQLATWNKDSYTSPGGKEQSRMAWCPPGTIKSTDMPLILIRNVLHEPLCTFSSCNSCLNASYPTWAEYFLKCMTSPCHREENYWTFSWINSHKVDFQAAFHLCHLYDMFLLVNFKFLLRGLLPSGGLLNASNYKQGN